MNVVIVGGGFAGVKAAHGLLKSKNPSLKVVLISDTPYFLFHATLYSTATGHDESESVIYLKDLFKNDDRLSIAIDSISNLDFNKKFVSGKISRYQYDELIVAIGSVTSYFSISGLKSHVFGVKSLSEVKHFRNHIKNTIMSEHVSNCNFFVIGGGATGVELAASLVFYIEKLCKERKISTKHYRVTLVEASERILPRLSKTASKLVTKRLIKLGISVLNNKKVSKLTDDYILRYKILWYRMVGRFSRPVCCKIPDKQIQAQDNQRFFYNQQTSEPGSRQVMGLCRMVWGLRQRTHRLPG